MFETVVSTVPLNPITVVLSYTHYGYNYASTVWFHNCYIEYYTLDTRFPAPAGLNVGATVYTYYWCGVYTIYPITTTVTATVTSTLTATRTITATIYPTTVTVRVPITHLNRNIQETVQLACVYVVETVTVTFEQPYTYTTTYYSCPRITVTPMTTTVFTTFPSITALIPFSVRDLGVTVYAMVCTSVVQGTTLYYQCPTLVYTPPYIAMLVHGYYIPYPCGGTTCLTVVLVFDVPYRAGFPPLPPHVAQNYGFETRIFPMVTHSYELHGNVYRVYVRYTGTPFFPNHQIQPVVYCPVGNLGNCNNINYWLITVNLS